MWEGGVGWWHKQRWLLGALWQEMPLWPSLPHSEGSGGFSLNLREPGLLGSPRVGRGGCHGHIPKAEHVPKANIIPKTDHIIMSTMTTKPPRPTVFLSDNCGPEGQPCPQAQSRPKATHVPMANNISKARNVPNCPHSSTVSPGLIRSHSLPHPQGQPCP